MDLILLKKKVFSSVERKLVEMKRHGDIHLQHKPAGSTLTRDRVNMQNPTEGSLGVET